MNINTPIYLDVNASTPPDPSAVAAMQAWLGATHANPHSAHLAGQKAAAAVDKAIVAFRKLINATSGEIIFTSGATESNNLALRGMISSDVMNARIICSAIEHKSVLEVVDQLKLTGATVEILAVDPIGNVATHDLEEKLVSATFGRTIVSIMHANNEIGTIQPISEISKLKDRADFVFHVDAAQSLGKLPINVDEMGVDLLSVSSHKIYGPAGIGALYISPKAKKHMRPIMHGGGQQNGMRPGTLPVFLIAGFGAACEKALQSMQADANNVEALVRHFCGRLTTLGVSFNVISQTGAALPGLLSIQFDGIEGDDLVLRVAPWLSISTGSACTSRELRSSHVLRALGYEEHEAKRVVRVGFGRFSTADDANRAAELIASAIKGLSGG